MASPYHNQTFGRSVADCRRRLKRFTEGGSEWCWFLLCFALFIVLGPFSAPIVLIAVFKLGLENGDHLVEPESIAVK